MKEEKIKKGIPKKKRKYNKKRIILFIFILVIIVLAIVELTKNLNKKEPKKVVTRQEENYIQILEDGTKLNRSENILQEKQIEGLTISNMQLTEKGNITTILSDIKNNTNEVKGGFAINIKLIDENGQVIITMKGFIPELQPNETTQLNTQTTLDFANAYDLKIEKAE